jgi:hypothetical protein
MGNPLGDAAMEKVELGLEIAMDNACVADCGDELLSVTRTVKLDPEPLGVPPIAPVAGLRDRPAGKLPAITVQV